MALPSSRQQFKDYCLRKLGDGAIKINVTDEQVEDRIDEALSYYADYHFDGTEETFFKHQVTSADVTNGFISVPENIIGLVELFDTSPISGTGWWTGKYQLLVNSLNTFTSATTNLFFTQFQIAEIQNMIADSPNYRYNRHSNKLYIDTNWASNLPAGTFILVRAYQVLDPATMIDIWKDIWLRKYATALVKLQWGSNLTKFEGMVLPGGVTFNGEKIYDDAQAEVQQLEDDMINKYSLPAIGLTG